VIFTYAACNIQRLLFAAKDANCLKTAVTETHSNDSTTQDTREPWHCVYARNRWLNGPAALSSGIPCAADSNRLDQLNHAENNIWKTGSPCLPACSHGNANSEHTDSCSSLIWSSALSVWRNLKNRFRCCQVFAFLVGMKWPNYLLLKAQCGRKNYLK
jgi:hypothetical protein